MTNKPEIIETAFVLRPSSAARWLSCPGSAVLEHGKVEKRALDFMVKTTRCSAAHYLLEDCLLNGADPFTKVGEEIKVEEDAMDFPIHHIVDYEMAHGVQTFLEHIGDPPRGAMEHAELFMQHSKTPELRGTADHVRVHGRRGYLNDLKFGVSPVAAVSRSGEKNKQLLCYATLMFDKFEELETVEAAIVQPRLKTKRKVREVHFTREECRGFEELVEGIAAWVRRSKIGALPLVQGSYCYFCKARSECPEVARTRLESDFGGQEVD